MAASARGTRSDASPPPPASRWWLSRRERKDIRRAVNDFRHDDDVYSVSRHGTTVVLMRHRNEHHKSQAPPQQPAGNQRQQKKVQTQGDPKQPGNRQQKKAERSALRAKEWHAAQALQRNTGIISATMQQQQPGNQVLLQPPQAESTSTKRSCSATATPTKAGEGSETTGGMGAPQSQAICAAHVRENAQRVRMHSPGGGPATGLLQCPSDASASGGPPQPGPASAGRPTQLFQATTAQPAALMPACSGSNTLYQSMLAHLRQHEYPQFMHHHMQQGMSQQDSHARWMGYEHFRMSGAQVSTSKGEVST